MRESERETGLPEVVVKVVGALLVGLVGEDDAGTTVVFLGGGMLYEAHRGWTVGHAGCLSRCCVAIRVGDQDIFIAMRG